MTIIKRADLGRPLTWDELDDNFQQVDELTAAASAAVSSASASAISAAGSAANSLDSATSASSSAADAAASAASAIDALMNSAFEPSSFDFTTGGTLSVNDRNKAVYDSGSNTWYSWSGTLPKTVDAGEDPLSDTQWIPRTDPNIRNDFEEFKSDVTGVYGWDSVGVVKSWSALKNTTPEEAGQRVWLDSYVEGSGIGGGPFIAVSGSAADDGGVICIPTGVSGLYWRRYNVADRVSVDWFGADPTGATYSSDAIRAAAAAYTKLSFQGTYKYGGAAIDKGSYDIDGGGSTIIFDSGVQWFNCSGTVGRVYVKDLYLKGGAGYFSFKDATANSFNDIRVFSDLNMADYTGTAIRYTDRDCPWWVVRRCVFAGLTNLGTIGLWDNGSDNNIVSECKFYKNQYHISTKLGSGTYKISTNDFGQFFTTGDGVPRASIWIRVPTTPPIFSGVTGMFIVEGNKFGNENETSQDVKLLLANAGTDSLPLYSSYSGGLPAMHFDFSKNFYLSNGTHPAHWMRSVGGWLPQTFSLRDENLQYADSTKGKYFCYMDNVTRTTPYTIYVERKAFRDSQILWRGTPSNDPLVNFDLINPSFSIAAGDPKTHSPYSAGVGNGVTDITAQKLPNVTFAGVGMSIAAATDQLGRSEAVRGNFATRFNNIFQLLTSVPTYQPGYIQGEIKLADDAPFDTALYTIYYSASTANTTVYNQFPLQLTKGVWMSYCFPVMFMAGTSTHCLILAPNTQDRTTYPNNVIWSRSRAFLGRTPGLVGVQKMDAIMLSSLPTSAADLPVGSLWVDTSASNTIKIVL